MRDPQGQLRLRGHEAVRTLVAPVPSDHFLRSQLAGELVASSQLIAFEFQDETTLVSPRLEFVSQPTEWCDGQLRDAARLTLDLADRAAAGGFELKDASAWNVLFNGARPVFCDHLSFDHMQSRRWWAAGQFARHFVVPLLLSKSRGLRGHQCFQVWRDGVPPDAARSLLGMSRFLTRCWPLIAQAPQSGAAVAAGRPMAAEAPDVPFRRRLHASLGWMLDGAVPRAANSGRRDWAAYVSDRPQYPAASQSDKQACVARWLQRAAPGWVADLGCNTGEYTRLAVEAGARVVAIDADHACIERLYAEHRGDTRVFPLVCALDDLSGGRGWSAAEHPGLPQRAEGAFDLVMMLALVHHLAVAASVPLAEVATLAWQWSRRWLIVECVHPADPQMRLLCEQRRRDPEEFSLSAQIGALCEQGFEIEDRVDLAPAARTLLLLRKPS